MLGRLNRDALHKMCIRHETQSCFIRVLCERSSDGSGGVLFMFSWPTETKLERSKSLEHLLVIVPDVSPGYISLGACPCVHVSGKKKATFATLLLIGCETRRTNHKLTSVVTWDSSVVPILVLKNETVIKTWKVILKLQPTILQLFSEK